MAKLTKELRDCIETRAGMPGIFHPLIVCFPYADHAQINAGLNEGLKQKKKAVNEEKTFLSRLPDRLKVFRGQRGEGLPPGISWTLNEDKAYWFATRFAKAGEACEVLSAEVPKAGVLYSNDRGEDEIILATPPGTVSRARVSRK